MNGAELVRAHLDGAELARHDRHDAIMLISLAARHGVCPLDGRIMTIEAATCSPQPAGFVCSCGFKVKA